MSFVVGGSVFIGVYRQRSFSDGDTLTCRIKTSGNCLDTIGCIINTVSYTEQSVFDVIRNNQPCIKKNHYLPVKYITSFFFFFLILCIL